MNADFYGGMGSHQPIPENQDFAGVMIRTATVNQSSFNTGENVYLYVVDANGNASNGYGHIIVGSNTSSPPDSQSPTTPEKNATEIAADSNIVVHVQDSGDGVDEDTIVMKVNDQIVALLVNPIIPEDSSDYTLTYAPSSCFTYGRHPF